LEQEEAADERDREDPEDELGGAPHCLEHGQNSFSDGDFGLGGKLEKVSSQSG
jgi:hypothetical protein